MEFAAVSAVAGAGALAPRPNAKPKRHTNPESKAPDAKQRKLVGSNDGKHPLALRGAGLPLEAAATMQRVKRDALKLRAEQERAAKANFAAKVMQDIGQVHANANSVVVLEPLVEHVVEPQQSAGQQQQQHEKQVQKVLLGEYELVVMEEQSARFELDEAVRNGKTPTNKATVAWTTAFLRLQKSPYRFTGPRLFETDPKAIMVAVEALAAKATDQRSLPEVLLTTTVRNGVSSKYEPLLFFALQGKHIARRRHRR